MSDDIHEVYAVRYAEHARKRSENYIFGDPHDEMTSIAYYVWVIKGSHGTFVVDTGFDETAAKERGRKIIHPVGEGLKALGVQPDKVQNVIATHMHWDHAGNCDLFPNARYHIQDTEMAYATGRCMCHRTLRIPFSEGDVLAMVRKVFAYRISKGSNWIMSALPVNVPLSGLLQAITMPIGIVISPSSFATRACFWQSFRGRFSSARCRRGRRTGASGCRRSVRGRCGCPR